MKKMDKMKDMPKYPDREFRNNDISYMESNSGDKTTNLDADPRMKLPVHRLIPGYMRVIESVVDPIAKFEGEELNRRQDQMARFTPYGDNELAQTLKLEIESGNLSLEILSRYFLKRFADQYLRELDNISTTQARSPVLENSGLFGLLLDDESEGPVFYGVPVENEDLTENAEYFINMWLQSTDGAEFDLTALVRGPLFDRS